MARHPDIAPLLQCLEELDRLISADDESAETAEFGKPKVELTDSAAPFATPGSDRLDPVMDLGPYEILGELGRGGMGVVYKAREKDLDRLVAIKMILAGQFSSAEQIRRFSVEGRAAARLQHPHIVRIHATGAVHGQHYLVMEYVDGRSLADVLGEGPLAADEAARCLAAVAGAVAHLHAHGIVHRDLKPSNILLDADRRPFVTDFGLAKVLAGASQQTSTGVILGTPSYMSPEQAAGRHHEVGPRSDVYSLGAILYEMLTGRPPFREESPLDTLVQVIESEPVRPRRLNPLIPAELEIVCWKCLEKDPENRYPSAEALADELSRFLAGDEVKARQPGEWQRLRSWIRREPALAARLLALAIFAAVVQVNYSYLHHESLALHGQVMAGLALWSLACCGFQACLREGWWPGPARFAWVGTDVVFLTALLVLTQNQGSPLIIGYPVLVASAGLWFRVTLVWFTTGVAAVAYTVLILAPFPRPPVTWMTHHQVLFLIGLVVLGSVVAYQVKRVRVLSRYYHRRQWP